MAKSNKDGISPRAFNKHTGDFERKQYNARLRQTARREIDKCRRMLGHNEQLKLL